MRNITMILEAWRRECEAVGRDRSGGLKRPGLTKGAGCEAKPETFVASYGVEASRN